MPFYDLFWPFLIIYNDYVPVHCQLFFSLHLYLQRKLLPRWPFTLTEAFSLVCMRVHYDGIIHMVYRIRFLKLALIQLRL